MPELPKIAALYLPDEDDYALVGWDHRRGMWFLIEGRPAGDLGPERVADLIEARWETDTDD